MMKNKDTISRWIDNDELDALIGESFERKAMLDDIHRQVMSEVRRTTRHEAIRHWVRLGAFAFGVPFVMLSFLLGIYFGIAHLEIRQPYVYMVFGVSAMALIGFLGREVRNFSISEV